MASIRSKERKDGSVAHRVFFRLDGRQTCYTFDSPQVAETFRTAVEQLGAERAIALHRLERASRTESSVTVTEWLKHHIDHLTGVDPRSVQDYRSYCRTDIDPVLGAIALDELSREDVRRWVQVLEAKGLSAKTIANKHGLLSAALNGAVTAGHIPTNPASGTRLPRSEKQEMVFLTHEEFNTLLDEVPDYWKLLVRFLVGTGARWGEVTALAPSDVNRKNQTVRIWRAWKRGGGGYRLGPPKTRRSVRTIDIPASIFTDLDLTGDWLFTNPGTGHRNKGGPVRIPNFRANVWWPATARAELNPRPRIHDLRHTFVSWHIEAGTSLPVIQRLLGHESIKTTIDVYGHLDRSSGRAAAAAIDKIFG